MGLTCPAAIVTLFLLELSSLYQDLPADLGTIPVENHELVVFQPYSQGSVIASNFDNVHILHVQEDPAYNPYFGLDGQSSMLNSKVYLNLSQTNTGTFLMAVNKQNQLQVETLFCVTYCIGNLSDPTMHDVCYDTINAGNLYSNTSASLLSRYIYEKNISFHIPVAYGLVELEMTPGNKSNVTFLVRNYSDLFFVDHQGVLRTGRNITQQDVGSHTIEVRVLATVSGVSRVDWALITVNIVLENAMPPAFEHPHGYTFSVKEEEGGGLSVGFVKALYFDLRMNGSISYSFTEPTIFFQINQTSGEIQTSVSLDRETVNRHMLTVVAADNSSPESLSSQVEVLVLVEDVNDNPPVFIEKEYSLSLSLYTQPGLLLRVNATDADVGQNAEVVYTITDGNANEMFRINSTSGELFLIAPLTVAVGDSIVLHVKADDKLPVNSLQASALVKITFVGVATTAFQEDPVALVSGVSVGGILLVGAIVLLSLYIWKKRRKRDWDRRRKQESLPMICTRQKEPRYDEHFSSMRKTEKRSSSNLYHLMNNSGSCVNLEHIEMEPWIPSPSQIPIHTSGSFSSESEFSMARFKGSQVVVEVSATKPKAQIGLTSLAQKSEIPSSHYEAKISNVSKDISKRESLKEGTHLESFQSTVVHRSPSAPTLLKQNSQNSVYQQLRAMTPVSEWRYLPGSRLNLEPESVSLATRDSCDRVLPHVESTGMKAEKEQRYSHTCLEHTERESQPLSLMPQQRSQSLVSLPDKCVLSARVNSAPSSTYGMQLSEMESEPPFPSLKGRPRTRILPNDGYAPVQAELAPSSFKGAQASCSVDSQSKSASLSTEELSTSLRTLTAENGEGYSQVSLRLSELDPESLSPSPKKRSDDSRSLTDFEGRVDQGDTSVVASYPRNVVESQTPVYPEVSRDLRTVTFKSLPALQPPDTTFEKSKEQQIKPTTGQTSGVKSSPCIVGEKCLADGVRKNLSSLEDISEGACHKEILSTERTGTPVLVSSSDNSFKSLSNEDVPLHRYNTALVGSSSFQIMSQFSRSRSPDKESNSSLEDNDVSSASKGNLREGEFFPTLETREGTLVSGLDELESPSSCKEERSESSLHLFEDRSLPERAKSVPNLLKRSQKGSLVDLITKSSLLLRAEVSQTLSSQVNPVVPRAVTEQSCSQAALEHRELGSESRATFSKKRSDSLSSFEDQLSSKGVKSARTVSDRSQETSRSSIELELHKLEAESPGTFSNQISDSLYLLKGQPPPERVKSTPTPSDSTRETSGLNSLKRSGPLLTKEFSENLLSPVRSAAVLTELGHSYSQSSLGLDGLESESLSPFTKQTSQSSSSSLYDQQSRARPKSASSSLRKPEIDSVGSTLQSALCLAKKKSQNLLPHPEPEASILVKGRKSSECGEDLGESSSPSSKDGSDSLSSVEHRLLSEKAKASPQSLTGSLAQAGLTSLSILAPSLTMVPSERLLPRFQPARTPTEGEQYSQEGLVLGKVECELLSSESQVSKLSQPSIEGRLSPAGVKAATSSLTEAQLNVYDEGTVAETFIIPSESSELIGGRFEDKEPVSRSTSISSSSKVMPGGVQSDTLSRAESLKKAPVGTSSQFRPSTSHLKDETRSPSCSEGSMDQDDVSVAASYQKELVESQNLVFPEVGRGLTITTSKSLKELQPLDTTFENSSEQPIKQTTGQQMKLESKSPSSSKEERSESLYLFDDRLLLEGATSVPNLLKGYKKGSYIELRSKSAPLLTAEISQSLSSQVEPVGARAGGEQCFSHAGRELGSESRATFSKKRTDSSPLLEDRLLPERVKSTPTLSERSQETSTLNSPSNSASLLTEEFSQSLCSQIWPAKVIAERGQSYSHGSLGQDGFESESLSQLTMQRSQSSSSSLHDQRSQAAPSSLRKLGISVSVDSALESSPCLAERQPPNLLPNPEPAASILDKQREFSESKEDVGESSPLWSKERSDGFSLLEHHFLPEKAEASSQSLLGSLAQAGVTSLSILAPLLTKVPSDRLLLPSQTARKPAFEKSKEQQIKPTTGQTSGVKSSPCIVGEKCLADGVRKNLSSLEDISEGACHKEILSTERTGTPVLVSSSDNSFKSLSNEDVPLHRYNTALVGSSSFQIMSQFSRSRSPDKESNSSLEDNDVSSASKGNLREGEFFPTLETREGTLVSGLDELESPSSCKEERSESSLHLFEDRSLPERAKSVPNLLKRPQKGSLVDLITKSSLLLRAEVSQTLSSQVNPVVPRAVTEQSCSQAALEHRELGSESRATFSKKRSDSLSSFEDQLSSKGVKSARTVSDRSQETSRSSIELELHKLEAESPGTFSNQISDSLYLLKGQPPPERVKSTPTPSDSTRETSGLNSLKRSGPLLTKEFSENLLSPVRSAAVLTELGHSYSQSSLGLDGLESESLSPFTKQTSQSSSSSLYDQQSRARPKSASSSLRKPEIDSVGSSLQSALCLAKKKSQNLLPHPEPEASILVKERKSSECGEDLGESSSPSSKDGSDSLSSVEHRLLSEKAKASPQSLTGSLAQAGLTSLSILAPSLTMVPSERLLPRFQPARTPTEGEQYSQEGLVLGKVECELLSSESQVSKLSQPSIEGRLSPAGVKAATSSLTEAQLNVYDEGTVAETFIIPSESSELIGGRFEDKEPVSRSTSISSSSKVMPGGVQSDTLSRAESLKKAPVGTSSQFRPSTSHLKDETRSPSCSEGSMDQDDVSVAASYKKELVESQNLVFPEVGRGLTITTSKSLKELQPLDTTFENSSEQPIKQTTGQQMKLESKSPSSSKEERSESLYLFDDRLLLEGATSVPNLLKGYQKGSYIELRSKSAPLLTAEISQSLSSQVEPVGARTGGEQCFSHAGRELGSESRATFSKKRTDSSPLLEDRLPPERVKSTPTLSERSQETSTLNSPSNSASLLTEEFSQSLCSQIWPAKVIAERGQSYSHGSLGQDGFESESLSQLTMQRSQSSSSSLHDQRLQAPPSSLRKLGISVSVDSALESSPCLAERQPPNLLPNPEPAASILDKQREFSESKEDVGESSPLWSKERSDRLSLLEHRFLPEKAEASPQSLLGSLAQAGVTSLSILAPLLTKVPSDRLLLPSQTARKPAEGERKDSQGSLILGEVETESPSSSVIAKSKPSSLTDVEVKIDDGGKITETMTLPSDFIEQISGRFESEKHISRPFGKSASSDVKTPAGNVDLGSLESDAQSKYSIQASVGTLPQRTLATSHLEGESRSAQDSLGRVNLSEMEYKSFDSSYPKHVLESQKQVFSHVSLDPRTVTPISLPALKFPNKSSSETEIKQSVGKRIVQVKSCPCIVEDYARETPSQMMGVRDDQNYEELPARDNSVTAVNSPSLDDSFTSSSNEDVPISSYKTALSGLSSFQIPHQFFHIETSDKDSTSSFEDNELSSASEGDLRDNESCTILKTHENIHVETFPEVLKSAERLIYLKTVDSHQTVMLPAFTVEQTEELSKLPLAETPRPSLSAPQRDDSERLPPRSSAEDSSSNEDVTLRSYTTVLLGSTSVRVPSQFFQIESSDKESSSSLENNEFSSSGEDNLRDNESCPMLETLEKLHVESSHEVLKVAGRLDHHKTLDSYQTHVLPTLTVEQTEDLSRLTVADSARPSFSVPRKNDPEKALFSSSSDNSFTSSSSEDVPIQSYRTALSDPLRFQIPSKFFQIESSDEESSCSFEDNELLSASEGNLHDNDKESRSYLEGTAFSPADEDDSPHKESFPKRYIQENVQNEMVIPVMKTDDRPLLPVAIMDASAVGEPGLASPKESQFAAGSSSHSFLDVDFLQQPKEADLLTEIYGVEKRHRTLTEVPSVLPSDLSSRTVSKVPPRRSRISKVGRKFKKIFEIGKSKNRHKELQKLEPEGDSSDFDGKAKEPPTSSHRGIGHPTSHSSVSTLRDNWPFLAVAVETTESSILHSKGIAPSGQDSISSDVASSSANLYASAVETERPAPVQSSIPRDRGILTTDDAAITQRVNEMISTIVKNARAALECKLKDEISDPPCSLSDAVTTQRINEMINTIVNNARAALKYKLKDAEMSLCEQSMKSSSESSLLATEPFLSPNAKDSLSIITEISQGNLECTLQDISRRPSSETSFSPFLVENREIVGQEPPCSLLDAATTQRINAMIKTIVSHARDALQNQLKENSSLDQPMKSNCESLLLATESSASPIIKESASCTVESLPGNLECLLQLEEIPSWTYHPDTWKESEVKNSPSAPENINVEEDTEKLQGAGSSVASRNRASSEQSHDDLTNDSTVFRAQED